VHAGVDGLRRRLSLPPPPASGFWEMDEEERRAAGARPLPATLGEALESLAGTEAARAWFGDQLLDAYLRLKRAEMRVVQSLGDAAAVCARYADAY
jgi:glutamine synthetase